MTILPLSFSRFALPTIALMPPVIALSIPYPKGECEEKSCPKWGQHLINLQIVGFGCALFPLMGALQKGIPWEKSAYFEQMVIPTFTIGATLFTLSKPHDKACPLQMIRQASRASFVGTLFYFFSNRIEYPTAALAGFTAWQGATYLYAYRKDQDMEEGINNRTHEVAPRLVGLAGATFLRMASLLGARYGQSTCFAGREALVITLSQSVVGALALLSLATVAHDTYG